VVVPLLVLPVGQLIAVFEAFPVSVWVELLFLVFGQLVFPVADLD
jgi:hypothetical protein